MKDFKRVDDDELLLRLTDGTDEMGLYPVLFGWRVRAGVVGEDVYWLDWCCGNDEQMVWATYLALRGYLRDGGDLHRLPRTSAIKPWWNDKEFQQVMMEMAKGLSREAFDENQAMAVPDFGKLRREYMVKVFKN